MAIATTRFQSALDWYLDHLGLIVSDFLYLDGQRERGPAMAFIRCDRGSEPTDHHTLAMGLRPQTGLLHSAYQVTDLDEVAASGEYLRERGYRHAWGIGRHIQGSQIFDYWRDPDRLMFEHFADGDLFDCFAGARWAPLSVSGLAQWGPKATREFTGAGDPATVDRGRHGAPREGQRDRPRRRPRPGEGDAVMSVDLARTADGWWHAHPRRTGPPRAATPTTGALLADRAALDARRRRGGAEHRRRGPAESLDLQSPVTVLRAGRRPDGELPLARPGVGDRPRHRPAGVLPQGLALGHRPPRRDRPARGRGLPRPRGGARARARRRPAGRHHRDRRATCAGTSPPSSSADDVSARQIQLTRTQFYESKSYPTFTPVGPVADPGWTPTTWPGSAPCG